MENTQVIKNVKAICKNDLFKSELLLWRFRKGVPTNGFTNSEEYLNWVDQNKNHLLSLEKDFYRIFSRCPQLKNDVIGQQLLVNYILFNKLICLVEVFPSFSIDETSLLGYIVEKTFVPISSHKNQNILNQYSAIKNLLENDLEIFLSEEDIYNAFLPAIPGNPGDKVYSTQQEISDLINYGIAILRKDVQNIKDFKIREYSDKNRHISIPLANIGNFALNRGLYFISEIFWLSIDREIQQINSDKRLELNRGIPLANAGVSQLAQGKILTGLQNLFQALKDDEKILILLQDPNTDPEKNLVGSKLYTQFESRYLSDIFSILRNPETNQRLLETKCLSNFTQLITTLSPAKRLYLFYIFAEFTEVYEVNGKIKADLLSRTIMIRVLANLGAWLEDEIKVKSSGKDTLIPLLQTTKGLNMVLPQNMNYASDNLDHLQSKITNVKDDVNLSQDDMNAQITCLIRNYSSHNFQRQDHSFFEHIDEYFTRMILLTEYLYKNSHI